MAYVLAIDCGATKTLLGLYRDDGTLLAERVAGPSNPVTCGFDACIATLAAEARAMLPGPQANLSAVGAAVAGTGTDRLREAVAGALCEALSAERAVVTDDMRALLIANAGQGAALVVLAGTGSGVSAQDASGNYLHIGGRGVHVGDEGSSYQLGIAALRAAAHAIDGTGPATALVAALTAAAGQSDFCHVPLWAAGAGKQDIAQLARTVTSAAERGDAVAMACVQDQARLLAEQAHVAYTRLQLPPDTPIYLFGGMIEGAPIYRDAFRHALDALVPGNRPAQPEQLGHAAAFALTQLAELPSEVVSHRAPERRSVVVPPTERRAAKARPLDALTPGETVEAMNRADKQAVAAVAAQKDAVAAAIAAAAAALKCGGRIIYIGAGTSGRLGVLDASECPPTFGVSPDRVVGIIAGGDRALRRAGEAAEDSAPQGAADLQAACPDLGPNDFVLGIAASGTTPYTLGALAEARRANATTALLCCNPGAPADVDIPIRLDTGPEVLTGSTRLKAGTATKLVLNAISTGAMAQAGYVFEGLMVGLNAANAKLRARAARIVAALTDSNEGDADALLTRAGGSIPAAVLMARHSLSPEEALRRIDEAGGSLRIALQDPS